MAGRLSKKEKEKEPQYKDVADRWLQYIGTIYEEYRMKYFKMANDLNYNNVNEDMLNDTILACYNSIARNNLSDTTEQGMRNYLFRAFKVNLNAVSNYDKRKDVVDDLTALAEQYENQGEATYNKIKKQLFDDYSLIYILEQVENNFDTITFHCFRLKTILPCTYQRLREITKVKDCKKRVVKVNKWLRENMTIQDIYNAFISDYPYFEEYFLIINK